MDLQVRIDLPVWEDAYSVYIFAKDSQNGDKFTAEPLVMRRVEIGEASRPTFRLAGKDQAQQLMDDLWRCGLRPTEGSGSAGSLAATERHLADMTRIAGAALNKAGIKA